MHTKLTSIRINTAPLLLLQKDRDTLSQSHCLLKKGREKVVICSTTSLRRFPIVKRSGCTAPFPFIPLLEARCLCLKGDRTTSLLATLHWSNTWELPLAWWEKQQEKEEEEEEEERQKERMGGIRCEC